MCLLRTVARGEENLPQTGGSKNPNPDEMRNANDYADSLDTVEECVGKNGIYCLALYAGL